MFRQPQSADEPLWDESAPPPAAAPRPAVATSREDDGTGSTATPRPPPPARPDEQAPGQEPLGCPNRLGRRGRR